MRELPKYKYYGEVWAIKIANIISLPSGGAMLHPAEEGYVPVYVNQDYLEKYSPHIGGYYVLHDNACTSFLPTLEFEKKYTSMEIKNV